jgi:CRP-like cAMP-binding protein
MESTHAAEGIRLHAREHNALLQALPADEYARIHAHLEPVSLEVRQILYVANEPLRHVYFPQSAILSLLVIDEGESAVEVGAIGKEGMAGLPLFHGITSVPHRCIIQIAGESWRAAANIFCEQMTTLPTLRTLLHRYSVSTLNDAAQAVACNRLHTIEARCARWLLATYDRVGNTEFSLAQEFLAYMLATRRPAVSEACSHLQRAGLIQYSRTKIRVLDQPGLEAAACACYKIMRRNHAMVVVPE